MKRAAYVSNMTAVPITMRPLCPLDELEHPESIVSARLVLIEWAGEEAELLLGGTQMLGCLCPSLLTQGPSRPPQLHLHQPPPLSSSSLPYLSASFLI